MNRDQDNKFNDHFPPLKFSESAIRLFASALFCADKYNGPEVAAGYLRELLRAENKLLADMPLVRTSDGLNRSWYGHDTHGRLRLLENADALLELGVDSACAAGIVTVGLTHVGRNRLADGNAIANPGGLTRAGRRLLDRLAEFGVVIDLAHLAAPGFWEVVAEYTGPIVCSHNGLRRFCNLPRNLSEEQVSALLERRGVIGIAFAPELLAIDRQINISDVFQHIDWFVQRYGTYGLGLGSDFGGFDGCCHGLENHAAIPSLVEYLHRAGYPSQAIADIMGEHWHRFYANALPPG